MNPRDPRWIYAQLRPSRDRCDERAVNRALAASRPPRWSQGLSAYLNYNRGAVFLKRGKA